MIINDQIPSQEIKSREWWESPMIRFTYQKLPNSITAWLKALWFTDVFVHSVPLLKLTISISIFIAFVK